MANISKKDFITSLKAAVIADVTIAVLGEMVVDGEIQKATIAVDGTTITIVGGEKIKVKRTMKYEQGSQV